MTTPERAFYKTREIAELHGVHPASIRNSLAQRGHFRGLRPVKSPGERGTLLWPKAAVDALIHEGTKPLGVAQRLRVYGRSVISASELRRACGISESQWMDCMRTRPADEKPTFWRAAGVEFMNLDAAISWGEEVGVGWASEESRHE